jgi:hypothetical protein
LRDFSRWAKEAYIEIVDFGLAAFSMFFMQSASFLAYQCALERGQGRSNGQTLFEIVDAKGKVTYSMAWVISLPVSKDNVAEIVACGRARWKIENESFNVLKNHGYELEHNFGHGQKFLALTLAALNLLAFAWHTLLELLEPPWQAAREAAAKRPHPHADRLRRGDRHDVAISEICSEIGG